MRHRRSRRAGPRRSARTRLLGAGALLALVAPWSAALASALAAQPTSAAIDGYVQLCGGPAPGRCRIETITACVEPGANCVTSDRVAAIDAAGRRIAEQQLHHARFELRVAPGRYTVELLGDGRRVHGRVMQRRFVVATAGATAVVSFLIAIP